MGQTHGRLLARNKGGLAVVREMGLAGVKIAYCLAATALTAMRAEKRNRFLLRAIMHAGVASGLLGVREIVQYGDQPVGAHGNAD
jgi:succinoglycan biosynthesis protein ExoM